nr:9206_t:CDS:2 [Entrophospora candida]
MSKYLDVLEFINNNELTLTKEILNEDEIIEMILNEVNEINDESGEGTDEPEAIVGDNDALGAINKLLIYIEQQNDSEFDENDYKNLNKRL